MFHLEHDDSGHLLLIKSELIIEQRQVDEVREFMKAHGIHRGIVRDIISEDGEPREAAIERFDEAVWECFFLQATMLFPHFRPVFEEARYARFIFWLVASGMPIRALDAPALTKEVLIEVIRKTEWPLSRETLDFAVQNAQRYAKSRHIRESLDAAKRSGVQLGNPQLATARKKALQTLLSSKPLPETLELMRTLRQEGKSLREIARVLNERGIKPPRGKQWHASSVKNQLS